MFGDALDPLLVESRGKKRVVPTRERNPRPAQWSQRHPLSALKELSTHYLTLCGPFQKSKACLAPKMASPQAQRIAAPALWRKGPKVSIMTSHPTIWFLRVPRPKCPLKHGKTLEAIQHLLQVGAIKLISREQWGSHLFTVPKRSGSTRAILNLKWLNRWMRQQKFKMETLCSILMSIRRHSYMTQKAQLRSASLEEGALHLHQTIQCLQDHEFLINLENSHLTLSHTIEHMGAVIDTSQFKVFLSSER